MYRSFAFCAVAEMVQSVGYWTVLVSHCRLLPLTRSVCFFDVVLLSPATSWRLEVRLTFGRLSLCASWFTVFRL